MEILKIRMFPRTGNIVPSGLAKNMDIVILSDSCVIYNKDLSLAKTIFISTRGYSKYIIYFIDNILPQLKSPVNVIIGGEDYTFPNNTDVRMSGKNPRLEEFKNLGKHKMINKLFVENLDEELVNTEPIPLGLVKSVNINYFLELQNINNNKPLKITNFNKTRNGEGQWKERGFVENLCLNHWKNFVEEIKLIGDYKLYLQTMSKFSFTICVHGGGLDVNPKLWESLLIGVIPIIKENKPYTDMYIKLDFPVVIVKKWDENTINEENLKFWHNKYYNYFTNESKRKKMLYALSLDYWVKHVSFLDTGIEI